jgi:tetratricopeptide (TPR) repeat protein
MTGWQRFARWRQENRDQRRLVQRLEDAYDEWQQSQQNPKYLMQGGLLEEWSTLAPDLRDQLLPRRELRTFFTRSDDENQQRASALEQALAEARLREQSRKIRDKLTDLPKQTVEAVLAAINTVGYSLEKFRGEVKHPAQDALYRAACKIRERLRLEGHTGGVWAVAFSPAGDRIVSGSSDTTLRLWDREGNLLGEPLQGHTGGVNAVAFSPAGDRIVSGSDDNTLRLWWSGGWHDWLRRCCTRLLRHGDLVRADDPLAQAACEICQDHGWTRAERAQFLVAQGDRLAYQNQRDPALAKFAAALEIDTTVLETPPQQRVNHLASLGLLAKGQHLAKDGKTDEAIATFETALSLDHTRPFDPVTRTHSLQALGLLSRGRSRLSHYPGHKDFKAQVQQEIANFQQAVQLDPSLGLDPVEHAYRLGITGLERQIGNLARQGQIDEAFAGLEDVQTHLPDYRPAAGLWASLARWGCLHQQAQHPRVQAAAVQAVEMAPENGAYLDTRGLYRALNGDYDGAIQDFQAFITWVEADEIRAQDEKAQAQKQQRQDWIEALQAGQDPFTSKLLVALREQ